MPDPMDLRQLRYFSTIVDRGSITGAADALGVAQPALSLHLKNMEAELGTTLLTRGPTGVTPTEAGRLLAARAQIILDEMTRTIDDIRTLEHNPTGTVRIGLPGTIAGLVALPLVEAASRRYPGITLNIQEAMSGFVSNWLTEAQVDIGVLYNASASPGIVSEWLLDEELVFIRKGPNDGANRITLADLDNTPMVLPSAAHGLRTLIDKALTDIGITPRVAVEIDAYASIKSLVIEGYGSSILPLHSVSPEIVSGDLNAVHFTAPGLWRSVHLVTQGKRPATRAQEAVRDLLRDVILNLITRDQWTGARLRMGDHPSGENPVEKEKHGKA